MMTKSELDENCSKTELIKMVDELQKEKSIFIENGLAILITR